MVSCLLCEDLWVIDLRIAVLSKYQFFYYSEIIANSNYLKICFCSTEFLIGDITITDNKNIYFFLFRKCGKRMV